ncbi:T9SS type B sorting domain-containing protein [Halocola ammonii]
MKNYLKHLVIATLFVAAFVSSQAQTLQWIGESGDWNSSSNWQSEADSRSNFSALPDQDTKVIFDSDQPIYIQLSGNISCGNLEITPGTEVFFQGSATAELSVFGDISQKGIAHFDCGSINLAGSNQQIDFGNHPSFKADLIVSGREATLNSSLRQAFDAGIEVCGSFDFNAQQVQTGTLSFCETAGTINLFGALVYVDQKLTAPENLEVLQNGGSVFVNRNSSLRSSPGNIDLISPSSMPETDCGTGPSQTPFTVEATVISDYNGQDVSCNDAEDGQAFAQVISGGVGPFTYMWINGPATQQYNGLGAGTYTVLVVDQGQGVSCGVDLQLTEPSEVNIFGMNLVPPTCADTCNGQASPSPFGGTPGYTFLWNNTDPTQNITTLCEGENNLQIFDLNGCVFDTTFNTPLDGIDFGLSVTDALCFGGSDGSATSSPSGGGGAPFTINWSTSDSGNSVSGLSAGNYTLTVEDVDGCVVDTLFEVGEGPEITLTIDSLVDLTCFESNDGGIFATVGGGVPPYTTQWTGPNGFNSANENITGLEAGTYNLTVTDDNGCQETFSATINQPNELTASGVETPVDCFGAATGSIDLTIAGGSLPYSISWTGPDGFTANTEDIANLEAGFYNATVTDGNGCTVNATVEVTEPNELQFSESITPITCFGDDDGAIDLNLSGGTPPYDVQWVGPAGFFANTEDISGLAPGDYDVTVTDDNSCVVTNTFTIDPVADITIDLTVSEITCNGSDDGAISSIIAGGTPPYTINWTGPNSFSSGNQDISSLEPGTYTIQVTDDNGCIKTDQVILNEPAAITVSAIVNDVTCNGFSDGFIDITTSGGNPGYDFSWTGPDGFSATTEDISGLEAGDYTLLVTDDNNCTYSEIFTIEEFPPIDINATFSPIVCAGEDVGTIDLTVTGGVSPYDFSWSGPNGFNSLNEDISGLEAGDYTVIVGDQAGCSDTATYTIDSTVPILIEATFSDPVCNGDSNGQIDLTISGGSTPYSIVWNTTDTSEDLTGLPAGTYSVEVTDDDGCVQTDIELIDSGLTVSEITLTDPPLLTLNATPTDIACFGDTLGTIDLEIVGGIPPYNVSWSGPDGFTSTDEDLSNILAGDYTVTVTDDAGCVETTTVTVDEPAEIVLDATLSTQLCGDDLGSIDLEISGGIAPYTTEWVGPNGFNSASEDLTDLEQGSYTVTVTDDNGCQVEEIYEITGPDTISVNSTPVDLDCSGIDNGTIEIEVSGGTTPYTITWNGPDGFTSNDEDIFNLAAGSYDLNIEDDNACTFDTTITLNQPDVISITNAVITPPLCNGEENASIELETAGGTPPLNFNWTGPDGFVAGTEDIFDLAPGVYDLQITDQGNCQLDTSFTIVDTPLLELTLDPTNVSCFGENDGSIDLSIAGGTAPYSTAWTGPNGFISADEDIFNLEPGLYEVTVTDSNLCEAMASVEIVEGIGVSITTSTTPSNCDIDNGTAVVDSIGGGTAPYNFSWEDNLGNEISTDSLATGLSSGDYTVFVTDSNGCQATQLVTVENTASATLDAAITEPLCFGDNNGTIDLTISSGTPPFDVSWSGPDGFASTDEDISDLEAGTYSVSVTDDAGCLSQMDFEVTQPGLISVDATLTYIACNGDSSGAIEIIVNGGTPDFDFSWTGPNGFASTDQNIDTLLAGTYNLEITDTNGCTADTLFTLSEADPYTIDIALTDTICFGAADGQINVTTSGATPPYNFNWTSTSGGFTSFDEDIFDLVPGDYILTITDDNGCTLDTTVTIHEADDLTVTVDQVLPDCQQSNGSLTANPTGGQEGTSYSYFWYDVEAGNTLISQNQTLSGITAGIYYLEVFDDLGCSATATVPLSDDAGTLSFDITDVLCNGANTGAIDMTVTDATDPVTISWSGPDGFSSSDEDINDLFAGDYTVQVTDDLGCELNEIVSITEPDSISIELTTSDITCAGLDNGTISAVVTGGVSPYSFDWTGPNGFNSTDQDISDLEEGCYTVTVTDDNGCVNTADTCLTSVPSVSVMATVTNIECAGDTTGMIDIDVMGGTTPYTLTWTGPDGFTSDQEDINQLVAGEYDLNISDVNLCGLDTTFTVEENAPFDISANMTNPSCPGTDDGAIDITVSGGTGSLDFSWTGPNGFASPMEDISGLENGDYELTITDSLGCSVINTIPLADPDSLQLTLNAMDVTCNGAADGSITLEITGGTEPYDISWTGPDGFTSDQAELEDLEPGTYSVSVTDDNGCSATATAEINEYPEIDLSINDLQNESCPETMDGFIDIDISGGLPSYNFNWSGPDGFTADTEDIDSLSFGTYSVSITDSVGCEVIINNITLSVADSIDVSTSGDIAECFGDGPYLILGSSEGSTVDQQNWTTLEGDTLSTDETLEINPEAGVYEFIYTATAGNCSATDTVSVEIFELPDANAGEDDFVFIDEIFTIGGDPTTGSENTVSWSPGDILPDSTALNPSTSIEENTTFYLTVTSPDGCVALDTVVIEIVPEIDIPSGFSPNGDGINELWLIGNIEQYPNTVIEVYNRWGDLLHRSAGVYEPWDGKYEGNVVPVGTYYYVIDINEPEFQEEITGPVTILR